MLNAFSRDIRSVRAQENIGVHLGAPLLVEHFPEEVIHTYRPIVAARLRPKLIRGSTSVRCWHIASVIAARRHVRSCGRKAEVTGAVEVVLMTRKRSQGSLAALRLNEKLAPCLC